MSVFVNSRRSSLRIRNACSISDVIGCRQNDINEKSGKIVRRKKSKAADDSDVTLMKVSNGNPKDIKAKSGVLLCQKKSKVADSVSGVALTKASNDSFKSMSREEENSVSKPFKHIIGIDEAGRGKYLCLVDFKFFLIYLL